MTNPANPDGQRTEEEDVYLNPAGGVVGRAFSAVPSAVPPEIQQILNVKPGKTSSRIQQVIAWAAAADMEVVRQHRRHNKSVRTTADIHAVSLREKDHVAQHFARQYRHRAALTGAVTALPGGLWALVGLGADVQLTAIYAVRMAAKIAQSYGYDTSIVEEQANLADVLALAAGVDSLRGMGNWLAREGLVQFLPEVLPRVLARLSVVLTAEQTAKWVGRIVPGVSAAIGATVDYAFLRAAGERAIAYYHNRALNEGRALPDAGAPLALPAATASAAADSGAAAIGGAATLTAPPPASTIVEAEPATPPARVAPAPVAAAPAAPATPREPVAVAPVAPVTPEAPSKPAKKRSSRWRVYLVVFFVFITLATIIACAAFGTIITNALQNVIH